MRPETFPKVEDTSSMILHYKNGVGIFEGSWDLLRSFQDLEVFGLKGSVYMTQRGVELKQSKGGVKQLPLEPLPPERAEPIAYMADALRNKKPIEVLVALDINVGVNEIIDAAIASVKSGQAVKLK